MNTPHLADVNMYKPGTHPNSEPDRSTAPNFLIAISYTRYYDVSAKRNSYLQQLTPHVIPFKCAIEFYRVAYVWVLREGFRGS